MLTVLDFELRSSLLPEAPPVRVTQEVQPVEIFKATSGKIIVDFGQNLGEGFEYANCRSLAGRRLVFVMLKSWRMGELGIRPLRDAKALDAIIATVNY